MGRVGNARVNSESDKKCQSKRDARVKSEQDTKCQSKKRGQSTKVPELKSG